MMMANYFMQVQFYLFFAVSLAVNVGSAALKIHRNLWKQILPETCFIYFTLVVFSVHSNVMLDETVKTFLIETCCTVVMAVGIYAPIVSMHLEEQPVLYFLWSMFSVLLCIPAVCFRLGILYTQTSHIKNGIRTLKNQYFRS